MRVNEDADDWVVIGRTPHARKLAFQRAAVFVPPQWPDPHRPQQLHLDIRVDDVDRAEQAVLALGARRLPANREEGFRSSRIRPATRSASSSGDTDHDPGPPLWAPSGLLPGLRPVALNVYGDPADARYAAVQGSSGGRGHPLSSPGRSATR